MPDNKQLKEGLRELQLTEAADTIERLEADLEKARWERHEARRELTDERKTHAQTHEFQVSAEAKLATLEAEALSEECVCGKEHRPTRMAGTDAPFEPGDPKDPECRLLTWREVAEKNAQLAVERRSEGRAAHLKIEVLEAELAREKADRAQAKAACDEAVKQRERDAAVLEALRGSGAAGVGGRVVARSHPKQQLVGRAVARQVIDVAIQHAQEQVGEGQ